MDNNHEELHNEVVKKQGISRRGFLKGMTAGAVSLAAAGIFTSCASVSTSGNSDSTSEGNDASASTANTDWLGEAPVIADKDITENYECDVVVIGSGNAGIAAARKAAEAGAKVMVLEIQKEENFYILGTDFGCVNSKYFLEKGAERIDEMEFLNEWQKRTYNRSNPALIKQYAFRSGECFDWIQEEIPAEIQENYMCAYDFPGPKNYTGELSGYKTYHGCVEFRNFEEKSAMWQQAYTGSIEKAKSLGAEWHFATKAEVLVQDAEGNVTGVIASNVNSEYIKYTAKKGVLLACGDFSGDSSMVYALVDEIRELALSRNADTSNLAGMGRAGIGHKMGLWAGAVMEPGPRAHMNGGGGAPSFPFGGAFPVFGNDGKRKYNEAIIGFGGGNVASRMPVGSLLAIVTDAKWRDNLEYQDLGHSNIDLNNEKQMKLLGDAMAAYVTGAEGFPVPSVGQTELRDSTVFAADTLDELADILGYSGDAKAGFLAEIEHWNEMCAAGADTDFGVDKSLLFPIDKAPFFGVSSTIDTMVRSGMVQLSGLVTDDNQQCLRADGSKIKGLFATGNCCGNRYSVQYHTIIPGNSVGIAATLGMCAGEYIAQSEE